MFLHDAFTYRRCKISLARIISAPEAKNGAFSFLVATIITVTDVLLGINFLNLLITTVCGNGIFLKIHFE